MINESIGNESLSDIAYSTIKKNIISLVYPPGSFLTEAFLAEELNTSRMPIRTAIHRLVDEGWLVSNYRHKVKIKDINREDVEEIFQLRQLLETNALQLIFAMEKTWEYSHRIEAKVVYIKAAQDDPFEFERAETEMHMEMVSIFNSRRIDKIYRSNQEELIRIGMMDKKVAPDVQFIIGKLYEFVEAIRNQQLERVLEISQKYHIETGREKALRVINEKQK